jgi:hypothetical protein
VKSAKLPEVSGAIVMADLASWLATWHDAIPLVGSVITAGTTALVALIATWSLNRSIKQTEFFLKFTERFHGIMQSKNEFELELLQAAGRAQLTGAVAPERRTETTGLGHLAEVTATEPGTEADDQGPAAEVTGQERDTNAQTTAATVTRIDPETELKAYELYRQLFGLMFDEFFAYKGGFLARDALVEWMRWRTYAYRNANGAQFTIGPVSYAAAWNRHARSPVVQSEFVNFLGEIHRINATQGTLEARIRGVVWRYTPRGRRFLCWLWTCATWAVLIIAVPSALYATIRWGWPAVSGLIGTGLAMLFSS